LERKEPPNLSPDELQVTAPTIIVHGTQDYVVPVEVSRRFAQKSGVSLIETPDGHRLHDSLGQIVQAVNSLANNLEAAEHAACQLFDDEA
jgi:pimeloyl-ACP methyl ester carboxylesterase